MYGEVSMQDLILRNLDYCFDTLEIKTSGIDNLLIRIYFSSDSYSRNKIEITSDNQNLTLAITERITSKIDTYVKPMQFLYYRVVQILLSIFFAFVISFSVLYLRRDSSDELLTTLLVFVILVVLFFIFDYLFEHFLPYTTLSDHQKPNSNLLKKTVFAVFSTIILGLLVNVLYEIISN